MKKLLIVLLLTCASFIYANIQAILPNDAKQKGIVTQILWQSPPVKDEDIKKIIQVIHYPHDDVASYALVATIVLNPENLKAILHNTVQSNTKINYNCKKIAKHILELQAKGNIIELLTKELDSQPLSLYKTPQPEDFYRDIIVYGLIREARQNNITVQVPLNIKFQWEQEMLLKYAWKPESQAWDYLYPQIKTLEKKNDKAFALWLALSAYSKVFFDEAVASIQSEETPEITRIILIDYLIFNQSRLNQSQKDKLKELQIALEAEKAAKKLDKENTQSKEKSNPADSNQ